MSRFGSLTTWLDKRLYPDFSDNWDNSAMRRKILSYLRPDSVVLDLGAGAGIVGEMDFSHHVARVCGIDPDPVVLKNPRLDEAKVAGAEMIPYADAMFDLVFANNVMEHLQKPEVVFADIRRVLKSGGILVVKTPNTLHYVAGLARLTPLRFHKWINRLRGRAESDTYPTVYRANSAAALERLAAETGINTIEMELIEGRPEYLRLFWPAYLLGAMYERLVNSTALFRRFRVVIIAVFRKP